MPAFTIAGLFAWPCWDPSRPKPHRAARRCRHHPFRPHSPFLCRTVGANRPPIRGAINLDGRTSSCLTAVTSVSAADKCEVLAAGALLVHQSTRQFFFRSRAQALSSWTPTTRRLVRAARARKSVQV